MLDHSDQDCELARWIYSLPCRVRLPSKLDEAFEKTGPVPAIPGDVRSGGRLYCRGSGHRAALEYRQTLPALPREAAWHGVYTTDFSRRGCGFLHSEVLYPGERMRLILLTGLRRVIEVAWCRRIDESCYAVGSRFVAATLIPTSGAPAHA
jgi:hypothetical protein